MSDGFNIVILAAGKGTRLKINTPKPLCKALGKTLVEYVIEELDSFSQDQNLQADFNVIVGHEKDLVQKSIEKNFPNLKINFIHQKEQLGTGHAVQTFFENNQQALKNKNTLVVCADTPLLTQDIFFSLYSRLKRNDLEAVAATFMATDPTGLGRIVRGEKGFSIVEHKDASDGELAIKEVNAALYIFKTQYLRSHIDSLDTNNKSGEFYLTDLLKKDRNVSAELFEDENLFLGVNDLVQLELAEEILSARAIRKLQRSGVIVKKTSSQYIESSVEVGRESIIYPHTTLIGQTKIGQNCIIESGVVLKNTVVLDNSVIRANSYCESAHIGNHTQVGPMARLREGTKIGDQCKIGNFVETKKAQLDKGAKVSHLSYVGDAQIGENTNIGCGFITCNYDGAQKHQTIIGKNSFIGSDVQTIAPLSIGDNAYIGSGSTINKDVPDNAFAIARERQTTKEDMAKRFLKKK
ncbi:MAG: UDP-N-acetylglucosamine diphosphorylase/glucosamine-1-phosphate N-acetyltransferase [Halobacteriovoraceae bacterium]|nr:UDP-N-acetylglucosamine diphosphorylase/glucosamine-1-phosphate N-acetyltransferase [Halobacteriovoraceae bacterium]|tara:strand:- start:11285 stop:12682 length:1398 start_codon:yes stop_codon:yes gene_type:complete